MSASPVSPRLAKGAFIEFSNRFGSAFVPNVILFQYNPESMTRKLEGWKEESDDKTKSANESATAQPFDPGETISFKLELDAADLLNQPALHPIAVLAGVTDRIAAIEMLMYPQEDTTLKGLLKSAAVTLGGAAVSAGGIGLGTGAAGAAVAGIGSQKLFSKMKVAELQVPRGTVPTVLFTWSPGRIVPVRITSFSVEEQAYNPSLYVQRAKVDISLKILAPKNLPCGKTDGDKKAVTAYNIYQRQKRDFAAANIASTLGDLADDTLSRFNIRIT